MRLAFALLVALVTVSGAGALGAASAWAHGGNFREDGPQGPQQDAPEMAPQRGRPTVTERAEWLAGDWATWWRLNQGALLPDKRLVRSRAQGTVSRGLFEVGESGGSGGLSQWERAVAMGAGELAVPFLLELLDPAEPQDERIISAALVALGRIGGDAQVVRLLQRYAVRTNVRMEVRESAILGLGLMRRTDRATQLRAKTLTSMRSFLLRLFGDKDAPTRARAFALYSLGFLADQPYEDTTLLRDGRRVTQALWRGLCRHYPQAELPVALLTALGMQPPRGVPTGVRQGLRAIATDKPFKGRRWDALRRSHALTSYVRLDGDDWLPIVLATMRGAREHVSVRAAAAIALTRRAGDLGDDQRGIAIRAVFRSMPREPHWFAAGLEQIALARLLREDVNAGETRFLESYRIDRYLQRQTLRGRTLTRPYTALALGLLCYDLKPVNKAGALTLKASRMALLKGLQRGRGSDEVLGAFAVGLGLAHAQGAHHDLLSILQDRTRGARLRGHCAVALAQIGRDTPQVRAALHKAAEERVSPFVHTGAVRALALVAPPETTEQLLAQLAKTRSRFAVAVVAGALGRFGDPAAAPTLVRLARDKIEGMGVRVMSVVALGLIFDPEPRPSRVRMTTHANYPSRTSALNQVFNIM